MSRPVCSDHPARRSLSTYAVTGVWLVAITTALTIRSGFAATINAASLSNNDVNAAVSSANDGDTVVIPAGTASWSWFTTTKAITLQGAGTSSGSNLTKITLPSSFGFQIMGANKPFRLTGIYFDCIDWNHQFCVNFYGPGKQFRVDHCVFKGGARTLTFGTADKSGPCWGVVDHCEFIDTDISLYVNDRRIGDSMLGDKAWSEPIHPGSAEGVVLEDCTFTHNSDSRDEDIYCDRGAKVTVRNSVFNYKGSLGLAVDAHGGYAVQPGSLRGVILYEFYNNVFNINTYRACHLRGGTHFFWNNSFKGNVGTAIQLDSDYSDYIRDSYFWNNTINGSQVGVSLGVGVLNTGLHVLSYYTHAPQQGQTYFGYAPLQYPHPLVSGSDASAPTPQPTATPDGTGTPPPSSSPQPTVSPTPLGLTFNATDGSITPPFQTGANNIIFQSVETDDPANGGEGVYVFTVAKAGDYMVTAMVDCADNGSNSFFINIDSEPTLSMVWPVPVTSGLENRTVTFGTNSLAQTWNLSVGTHQLFVRGREASAKLGQITIAPTLPPPSNLRVAGP